MEIPQIRLEKRISPDNPQGNTEYYLVTVPGFSEPLYGSLDENKAIERFRHIQEIGYKAYLEEIKISTEVLMSEDFNYPELVEALEKNEANATVIGDNDNDKEVEDGNS